MKKKLLRNLGLKLLSVMIAVVLWFVVVMPNNPKDTKTFYDNKRNDNKDKSIIFALFSIGSTIPAVNKPLLRHGQSWKHYGHALLRRLLPTARLPFLFRTR